MNDLFQYFLYLILILWISLIILGWWFLIFFIYIIPKEELYNYDDYLQIVFCFIIFFLGFYVVIAFDTSLKNRVLPVVTKKLILKNRSFFKVKVLGIFNTCYLEFSNNEYIKLSEEELHKVFTTKHNDLVDYHEVTNKFNLKPKYKLLNK